MAAVDADGWSGMLTDAVVKCGRDSERKLFMYGISSNRCPKCRARLSNDSSTCGSCQYTHKMPRKCTRCSQKSDPVMWCAECDAYFCAGCHKKPHVLMLGSSKPHHCFAIDGASGKQFVEASWADELRAMVQATYRLRLRDKMLTEEKAANVKDVEATEPQQQCAANGAANQGTITSEPEPQPQRPAVSANDVAAAPSTSTSTASPSAEAAVHSSSSASSQAQEYSRKRQLLPGPDNAHDRTQKALRPENPSRSAGGAATPATDGMSLYDRVKAMHDMRAKAVKAKQKPPTPPAPSAKMSLQQLLTQQQGDRQRLLQEEVERANREADQPRQQQHEPHRQYEQEQAELLRKQQELEREQEETARNVRQLLERERAERLKAEQLKQDNRRQEEDKRRQENQRRQERLRDEQQRLERERVERLRLEKQQQRETQRRQEEEQKKRQEEQKLWEEQRRQDQMRQDEERKWQEEQRLQEAERQRQEEEQRRREAERQRQEEEQQALWRQEQAEEQQRQQRMLEERIRHEQLLRQQAGAQALAHESNLYISQAQHVLQAQPGCAVSSMAPPSISVPMQQTSSTRITRVPSPVSVSPHAPRFQQVSTGRLGTGKPGSWVAGPLVSNAQTFQVGLPSRFETISHEQEENHHLVVRNPNVQHQPREQQQAEFSAAMVSHGAAGGFSPSKSGEDDELRAVWVSDYDNVNALILQLDSEIAKRTEEGHTFVHRSNNITIPAELKLQINNLRAQREQATTKRFESVVRVLIFSEAVRSFAQQNEHIMNDVPDALKASHKKCAELAAEIREFERQAQKLREGIDEAVSSGNPAQMQNVAHLGALIADVERKIRIANAERDKQFIFMFQFSGRLRDMVRAEWAKPARSYN